VIDPKKKIRLVITYPQTTGRNFDEILRVIDSLQLTDAHRVATPVNWKQGEDVIIVPAVTDEEVRRVYALYARELAQPLKRVQAPLRTQLERDRAATAKRRYLAALRTKYDARLLAEPARLQVKATGPTRGPAAAAVTIVLFSDFECPYCQRVMPALEETLLAYPSEVRLIYRHLPLGGLHPHAAAAAAAGVCADRQGRFWPFLNALFAAAGPLEAAELRRRAAASRLDMVAFDACLASDEPRQVVAADSAAADALGLSSTPSLLINGRLVRGAVPAGTLAENIDDEIARQAIAGQKNGRVPEGAPPASSSATFNAARSSL
jgi:protein-disulfide isomerase